MTGILLLALTMAQAAPEPAGPVDRIEVGVVETFADGASRTTSRFPGARLIYVSSKGSMCDAPGVAGTPSDANAFGAWKVEVEPVPGDARIVWRRLEGAAAARGAKNGIRTLPIAPNAEWTALDHLDIPARTGCRAAHWSLVARRRSVARTAASQLVEAELWFVHKAPDGKETTQRQVVRVRQNGRAEFYFDDIELQTRWLEADMKLTVEVFGALIIGKPDNGEIALTLNLTRRYLTKQRLIGAWPKSGSTELPTKVAIGEVVSFVLPPLQDDAGVFLGHRFSVRMRLKPLAPEAN
jgi:hypothetical protein